MPDRESPPGNNSGRIRQQFPAPPKGANGAAAMPGSEIEAYLLFDTPGGSDGPEAVLQSATAGGQGDPFAQRLAYVFRRVREDATSLELLRQILVYRTRLRP